MGDEPQHKRSPLSPVRSVGRGLSFTARQVSRMVRRPFGRQDGTALASAAAEAEPHTAQGSGPLERLRIWNPFKKADLSSVAAECFPRQLCRQRAAGITTDCQDLLSIGCRNWGNWWDGRSLLRVKLYDFAVYMDGHQIQHSRLSRKSKGRRKEPDAAFFRALRSSDDVSMSLMVRAARNLPIPILAKEYERILKRRLQIVGGSPDDAALSTMLACFKKEKLPSAVIEGNAVRKGAVLTFTKDTEGHLTAKANNDELISVQSPKLGQAIFDLYLGENPVSRKAKLAAGQAAAELMAGRGYTAPQEQGICFKDAEGCQLSLL